MPITLRTDTAAEIIRRILSGSDHRDVIVDLIDAIFISDVLAFFEKVVYAKMRDDAITTDWYKDNFLDQTLPKEDVAMSGGLNMKTIHNKRRTTRKSVVVEEALEHHDKFIELIESLSDDSLDIKLSISIGRVTVELTLNESLVVINALAVRRATIRGGAWSTAGKQVEGPLMESLCRLFSVDERYFTRSLADDGSLREVDFYLLLPEGNRAKCEVKLMGSGNPESADAVIARDSRVFVASTLSDTNTTQLDSLGVLWTELQTRNGFLRFQETLMQLGIPHSVLPAKADYTQDIERAIEATFASGDYSA